MGLAQVHTQTFKEGGRCPSLHFVCSLFPSSSRSDFPLALLSVTFPQLVPRLCIFPTDWTFTLAKMRIQLSSAILLIAVATVTAAPTPPTTDSITDQLKAAYDQSEASMDCGACVAALAITKRLDRLNRQGVLNAFKRLCPSINKQTLDVVMSSRS